MQSSSIDLPQSTVCMVTLSLWSWLLDKYSCSWTITLSLATQCVSVRIQEHIYFRISLCASSSLHTVCVSSQLQLCVCFTLKYLQCLCVCTGFPRTGKSEKSCGIFMVVREKWRFVLAGHKFYIRLHEEALDNGGCPVLRSHHSFIPSKEKYL